MLVVDNCQNVSLTTTKPGVMTGDELRLNAIFVHLHVAYFNSNNVEIATCELCLFQF
jgi:hypothetical protein